MPQTSALEQWLLELINAARRDPSGVTAKYGVASLNDGLEPGTISAGPKAAMAMSNLLQASADFHGQYSLEQGTFDTVGYLGSGPGDRMAVAGFENGKPFDWAEAINWRIFDAKADVSEQTVAYNIWLDLIRNPETRAIILSDQYTEIGVSLEQGLVGGTSTQKGYVAVNDIAAGSQIYITGGVYQSTILMDDYYSPFQGIAKVKATVGTIVTESDSAGGYRVEVGVGQQTLQIGKVRLNVNIRDENTKIDLVGTGHIRADHSVYIFSGANSVELLGKTDINISLAATSGAIFLDGNSGKNKLVGSNANNVLDGKAGADHMEGGKGDDRYMVDNVGDVVIEQLGGGQDTVVTTVSFALKSGSEVENVRTMYEIFQDAIDLTGNELSQTLTGNHGNNKLDGNGGGDWLYGSLGDDLYIIRNAADQIQEYAGEGNDSAQAATSFSLAADDSIETLMTTNSSGKSSINLTGNDFDQYIRGNNGANVLDGLGGNDVLSGWEGNDVLRGGAGNDRLDGGSGQDRLTGGSGSDQFYFTAKLGSANADTISDFTAGADRIYLEKDIFVGLAGTRLANTAFKNLATSSVDATDRIIVDNVTGKMYFDADGSGSQAAQLFGTVEFGAENLSASDFWLV